MMKKQKYKAKAMLNPNPHQILMPSSPSSLEQLTISGSTHYLNFQIKFDVSGFMKPNPSNAVTMMIRFDEHIPVHLYQPLNPLSKRENQKMLQVLTSEGTVVGASIVAPPSFAPCATGVMRNTKANKPIRTRPKLVQHAIDTASDMMRKCYSLVTVQIIFIQFVLVLTVAHISFFNSPLQFFFPFPSLDHFTTHQ
jgi:hypothetical protein